MVKTIKVPAKHLQHCAVKHDKVTGMTLEEMLCLVNWCNWQDGNLWEDMSLQEILNVYRVSAAWETWEGWASEDREAAHVAWNKAVIDPGNQMYPF